MRLVGVIAFGIMCSAVAATSYADSYQKVDLSKWTPKTAKHPLSLVEQLYAKFPESDEGKPNLNIRFKKDGRTKDFTAIIEMTGYLDDSLAGEKYRAVIKKGNKTWKLISLGKQWKCYRGTDKGWHTKKCP